MKRDSATLIYVRFMGVLIEVRRGEGMLVLKTTWVLFSIIAAHTLLETSRDALFLGTLAPSRLPLVYAMVAGLAMVVTRWNTRFVLRFGRRNALIFTLMAAGYGTTVLYLLPSSPMVVFGLYVWSALVGTIAVVQFWMFAGQSFDLEQGKRLFGLLAAGGVLGAVFAASTAVWILDTTPVETLILGAAAIFLGTSFFLTTIPADDPQGVDPSRAKAKHEASLRGLLQLNREHRYFGRLTFVIAIGSATVLATDYLFKYTAAKSFGTQELGTFFAQYYAVLNASALIIQLLVAGWLVQRLSVIYASVVLPLLLFSGGILTIILGGSLNLILLMKGADGSLRHSLHRISTELLWMPLPEDARVRGKALVDSVVVRLSQAFTALVLLFLSSLYLDRPRVLAGLIIALGLAWLLVALRLRRPYLDLFRLALQRKDSNTRHLELDLNAVEVMVDALSSTDSTRVIASMDLLAGGDRRKLIPALILYHDSEEVLLRALEIIGTNDRSDWIPLGERLLSHPEEHVRVAALRALTRAGRTDAVRGRLLDISPFVRAHAAFWLAHKNETVSPIEEPAVQQVMRMDQGRAGTRAQIGLLEAIRADGDDTWVEVILALHKSGSPDAVRAATLAMGTVHDPRFIPILIERLAFREERDLVRDAIVSLGDEALETLQKALTSDGVDARIRRHIPRTISRFGNQRAADMLAEQLVIERYGLVRYKILRGLGRLVVDHPVRIDRFQIEHLLRENLYENLRLLSLWNPIRESLDGATSVELRSGNLVCGLLQDKMKQALERAFRLLQIVHRNEDIRSVWYAVGSTNRRVRTQALEFLDTLTLDSTVTEIRELFRIVVDDLPPRERLARAREFVAEPPKNRNEAVAMLLREDDEVLAGVTAQHAIDLRSERLHKEVEQVSQDEDRVPSLRTLLSDMLRLCQEVPHGA